MKKLLASYRDYLEEKCSENTVQSYIGDITRFFNDCSIEKKKDITKIKADTVDSYMQSMKASGMSYSSIRRYFASVRKFVLYCIEEGVIKTDPLKEIDVPKAERKLPDVMNDEDVIRLLEAPDTSSAKGIRDRAMLEMMYATGARVSEITGLKMSDVSLKNEVVVLTTGKKRRFVPMGRVAIDALYNYLHNCRPNLVTDQSSGAVFLNFYGQPISRQGFWKIVKGYIEMCKLNSGITPQTLRNSFALHMLRNGADAHSVSEMLGYSDVSSTKIYFRVMDNRIKEVYKNAHPRA